MNKQNNFTQFIKNELISKKKNKVEIREFIRGFIFANSIIDTNIKLKIINKDLFNYVCNLLKILNYEYYTSKFTLSLDLSLFNLDNKFESPTMFFAGVFVGGGSISDLDRSSYHLHLSSRYENLIDILLEKLNEYDFGFQKIKHHNKFLIYVKKHEKISDFLKAISAFDSMFKFEDSRIQRDFDNSLNRINNVDLANIKKIVSSNQKHIKNIKYVFDNKLEYLFNQNQLDFFNLLLENPDESLSSLSDIYNNKYAHKISKSGLNHWLIKLNKISKST
ncbi:DNA-binding protein WhiA [Mycoplasmopsis mucosicanis]|uniref:Probable cell division protein WhiA n=1 Tax=Mycoplasmopsis mucosicanis TaxID=458208 RepID=A0A507SQV1_9BACT|nr:DNA-binding protein WhiA [Mycoplasmopsis mucosicanis]TQC54159.1 DNA-binding protein WhiA [Mycoplasmopsis mucosicanis]